MLVANVHIHWDPEYSDVKLIQTIMFMNELKKIVDEETISFRPGGGGGVSRPQESTPIPLVLCGDLNSLPDSGEVMVCGGGWCILQTYQTYFQYCISTNNISPSVDLIIK